VSSFKLARCAASHFRGKGWLTLYVYRHGHPLPSVARKYDSNVGVKLVFALFYALTVQQGEHKVHPYS
jgi:hypothetical protein